MPLAIQKGENGKVTLDAMTFLAEAKAVFMRLPPDKAKQMEEFYLAGRA